MSTSSTKTEVGSYFISNYPPFSAWSPDQLDEVRAAMNAPPANVPLGLYLAHSLLPQALQVLLLQSFTDKNSAEVERYLAALSREIELVSKLPVMGGRPFRFVYFGGGTPSFLSSRQLERLVDRLRANVSWDKAEEVTFECEPGTLSEAKVHTLREIGVTRLSLGVEHFDDTILRDNGRAHESPEIYKAWPWIQLGRLRQHEHRPHCRHGRRNLGQMARRRGPRDRARCRQRHDLPDGAAVQHGVLEGHSGRRDRNAGRRLGHQACLGRLRVRSSWRPPATRVSSAYTMVKHPERVNFSYRDNLWQGSDLLATGIASFGHISGVHYQNHPEWEQYCGTLESGELPLNRGMRLSPHQRLVREMILQLKRGYLNVAYFRDKFGVDILDRWSDVWAGLRTGRSVPIDRDADRIELTRDGLLQVDSLLPAFFEPQFQGVRYT